MEPVKVFAPTNIAFLKYWGKSDPKRQWPANDSLSMTLDSLGSTTSVSKSQEKKHRFWLNGKEYLATDPQGKKVFTHLKLLAGVVGGNEFLEVRSENNFPTGSGIASSASGMAALTLSALSAWTGLKDVESLSEKVGGAHKLSQLAILGSGSAGRSLFGGYVQWLREKSPDHMYVEVYQPQSEWNLRDLVVLFSEDEKTVSSSEAHLAAERSLLFEPRIAGCQQRLNQMKQALSRKEIHELGPLLEAECLEMHAVMMTADPAVAYFGAETSRFLADLRILRDQTGCGAYFTIDAGANVHVICVPEALSLVKDLIGNRHYLEDGVGSGPRFL
ncbi:MAG: diphosphomevalonate decarboxylase [Oligoflexales bacterium]